MKRFFLLLILCILPFFSGCTNGADEQTPEQESVVIGFSQSGTESSWRKQHTKSIRDELAKEGYQVMYRNGFMNQERQIQDIRTFIAYKVDIIVFTPLKEDGWEPVLKEAKAAGIPVIIVDRNIDVSDQSLFLTHIGPNFKAEGNRAGLYVANLFADSDQESVRVLELAGLAETSPTKFRSEGFTETTSRDPRIQIVDRLAGDFIRVKGQEQMRDYLTTHDLSTIDVLFSHSDEMTLGALSAIEETDIVPGKDLIIVTIDAQADMIQNLKDGVVNCVVECNPDAGWSVANTIKRYLGGKEIPREIYMTETVFSDQGSLDKIRTKNY